LLRKLTDNNLGNRYRQLGEGLNAKVTELTGQLLHMALNAHPYRTELLFIPGFFIRYKM